MKVKDPFAKEIWVPDGGQKIAIKYLLEHACGALLLDPGFGKTDITLAVFKLLKEEGLVSRMLVVAPKQVARLTWPEELEKFDNFKDLTYEVIHGANKETRIWESDAEIIITNFDSLPWLYNITKKKHSRGISVKVDRRRAKKLGFDVIVIDELSKVKNYRSSRHKILKEVTDLFKRRWGLTGSIAANGLMGLFGQCLVLDEGRTFGRFITHYRNEYFDKEEYSYNYTLKPGAEEKIYKKMAPLCLRLDETQQGVKIPQQVDRIRHIELPPKVQQLYNEMETELLMMVKNKLVTAANSAVASSKCRQICCGGAYVEPEIAEILKRHKIAAPKRTMKEWVDIHDEKLNALEAMMDELEGQPMFIAYDWRFTIEKLKKRFGKNLAFIGGRANDRDVTRYKQQWKDGEIQWLFAHPQAAAHGLNLQIWGDSYPRHVCWLEPTWNYDDYDQFVRRIRRRGNKMKRVFNHHIIACGTIEERMLSVLHSKRRTQNALHDAILELNRIKRPILGGRLKQAV